MTKSKALIPVIEVFLKDDRLWTTSLHVAERFGKRHDNVLQTLTKMECSERFRLLNFQERDYQDVRGKTQPMYVMTRGGFSLLAMGFTGKKAFEWKEKFIEAFDAMEQKIIADAKIKERQGRVDYQQARIEGKVARKTEMDSVKKFVEYCEAQGSSKAQWYYKHLTNATYKALGFIEKALPNEPIRDLLDAIGLSKLAMAEFVVAAELEEGMLNNIFYKEIFQNCKTKLERYADVVGRHTPVNAIPGRPEQKLLNA